MEQASQQGLTRDFSKLLLFFTETCTLPHKHVKPQKISTYSAMVDLSSHQHLQQDEYTVKEADAAMRSFMMHRFLRAAADVAGEHESSISPSKQKIVSKSPSPSSPQLSRRMPITCCIKSKAQQAHSLTQHSALQKDIMPRFMSAFFCLRLETLLFHAQRRVKSASGRFERVGKRSWVPHPSYRTRVANEGSSEIEGPVACKEKGDTTKHQSAVITDVEPLMFGDRANVKESHRKHAGFLRSKYLGSDDGFTNAGCHPPSSQSPLADVAGNRFHNGPHADYGWVKEFATMALQTHEVETVEKGMSPCKQAESPTKRKHDACAYEQKHERLPAELRTKSSSRLWHGSLDSISDLYLAKASASFPTYAAKCRNDTPNASGWPFGIYNSTRVAESSYGKQEEKNSLEKLAAGGKVPYPPLPPAPTESWLGHAVRKNASRTSLLASLQQKEKAALSRRNSKCQSVDLDAERTSDCQLERRWEDAVVKGSKPHSRHWRYSEDKNSIMMGVSC